MIVKIALIFILVFLFSTSQVKAIVVIIPTVLVPVVHIIISFLGVIFVPIVAISTYILKLKKRSLIKGVLVGILITMVFGVLGFVLIRLLNPDRPIY